MSPARMLAVFVVLGSSVALGDSNWSYRDIPEWQKSGDYPACSFAKQSPVNIDKSKAMEDSKLTAFKFTGYSSKQGSTFVLKNKGYTVQVDMEDGEWLLNDGNLNDAYQLLQMHFHWSLNDSAGSEHTIDGNAYPLEMHLVHKKVSINTTTEALNVSDGLAVLGVFFEIGEENTAYNALLNSFGPIKYKGAAVNVTQFAIAQLLPSDVKAYYRYMGSLTTPGCEEAVVWTVFMHTVKISKEQMEKFRNLQSGESGSNDGAIAPNFRPVQMLNGRMIHRTPTENKKKDDDTSASAIAHPTIATIIISLLFFAFLAKP